MTPRTKDRKVALVTGSSRRVGRVILLELARSGHDVVVHWRSSLADATAVVEEAVAAGAKAIAVRADLTVPADIDALFASVESRFGRLDVLVNSAAVFRRTPLDTLSEEDFDFHVDTNLKAPYLCSIRAWRIMRRAGGGKIVNIADVAAERPFSNHVPYCISKAGVVMLTRALAKAFAPVVQVNAIAPGTVLFRPDEDEAARSHVMSRIPAGGIGAPGDVARAVRFFCEQGEQVTGNVILVDGGRSLT